jgi:hypothetical protein
MSEEIREAIYKKIITEFSGDAQLVFDNNSQEMQPNKSYIYVTISEVNSERLELGNGSFLDAGTIEAKVLVPENDGTKKAWQLVDSLKNIFLNKRVGNLSFLNLEATRDGLEDVFFSVSVKIFFEKDFVVFK